MYTLIVIAMLLLQAEDLLGIINGRRACKGQFPHVAGIWLNETILCVGGIIDQSHILTAAHCIIIMKEEHASVTVGVASIDDESIIRIKAAKIYIHSEYKRTIDLDHQGNRIAENDIAIIKLAENLQWNEYVKPISIRKQPGFATCDCYIAGWGMTQLGVRESSPVLRWGRLFILPTTLCRKLIPIAINEICAEDPRSITAAGAGDSGGPVICNNLLVGIVVAGSTRFMRPTGILRIQPYQSFVDEVLSYSLPKPTPTPNVFEFLAKEGLLCT